MVCRIPLQGNGKLFSEHLVIQIILVFILLYLKSYMHFTFLLFRHKQLLPAFHCGHHTHFENRPYKPEAFHVHQYLCVSLSYVLYTNLSQLVTLLLVFFLGLPPLELYHFWNFFLLSSPFSASL
jgi:hypothetical protein